LKRGEIYSPVAPTPVIDSRCLTSMSGHQLRVSRGIYGSVFLTTLPTSPLIKIVLFYPCRGARVAEGAAGLLPIVIPFLWTFLRSRATPVAHGFAPLFPTMGVIIHTNAAVSNLMIMSPLQSVAWTCLLCN